MLGRTLFEDRRDAGRQLAARLEHYRGEEVTIVGLPRGGVEVAFEVSRSLGAPLDVIVAGKVGAPMQPELAIGAVAPPGILLLDEDLIDQLGLTDDEVELAVSRTRKEVERRIREYRGGEELPDLQGRTCILVDDGLATGATTRAAIEAARLAGAEKVVVAVPVCAPGAAEEIAQLVDELVCLAVPDRLVAIGTWYRHFDQTSDAQVIEMLEEARDEVSPEDFSEL